MPDFPTIPASHSITAADSEQHSRGAIIRSIDRVSVLEAMNYIAANRTNCWCIKTWMSDHQTGTLFDANPKGVLLGTNGNRTGGNIIWLRWITLAEDCDFELYISDNDINLAIANSRIYYHRHTWAGAGITVMESLIGVKPNQEYYWGITCEDDGVNHANVLAITLLEQELSESDISMLVEEYDTVALAVADGIGAGDAFTLTGDGTSPLMYMKPGADFEYPGRTDGPSNIAVPWKWRDANVFGVYNSTVDWNANPNSDWSWARTVANGGLWQGMPVGPPPYGYTVCDTTAAANAQAYAQINPLGQIQTTHLVYIRLRMVQVSHGVGNGAFSVRQDDPNANGGAGKAMQLSCADGAVAGDVQWGVTANREVSMGAADYFELLIEYVPDEGEACTIYNYQTMEVINTATDFSFGGTANDYVRIGCFSGVDSGETRLDGFPCVLELELPS